MPRRVLQWFAAALVAMVAGAAAALAAPPSWAASVSNAGSPGNAVTGPGHGDGNGHPEFGGQVSAAIEQARAAGATGTVLAEAIHEVLHHEHPNAKGLTVAMAVYSRRAAGGTGNPFADLSTQAPWATPAVSALNAAGVIKGTSPSTFSPNDPVTLAELATMLDRLQAGTAPSGSQPPSGTPTWATQALAWAQGTGVLQNEQGLGQPNDPLTRAQAVLMLINAAGLGQAANADTGTPIALNGYAPPWAHGALALAIQLGILQGSGGQLLADSPLTRAQMAVLMARLAVLESQVSGGSTTGGSGTSSGTGSNASGTSSGTGSNASGTSSGTGSNG